jgi:TolA-binding protein
VVALVALMIGSSSSGETQEQLDKATGKIKSLEKQLTSKTETVAALETENKELQTKVDEAKPWFELSVQEQENKKKESELKAAELEKQKKAEAEAAAKAEAEKAAAALAAKQKTLSAGNYVVGRDIDPGLYDTKAVQGNGNFVVTGGMFGLKVNEMFGVGGGFYNGAFNNLELEEGDTIEINDDLQVQFIPKQ